jgi:hypothetical protein
MSAEGGGPPAVPAANPEGLRAAAPQLRPPQEKVLQEPEHLRFPINVLHENIVTKKISGLLHTVYSGYN